MTKKTKKRSKRRGSAAKGTSDYNKYLVLHNDYNEVVVTCSEAGDIEDELNTYIDANGISPDDADFTIYVKAERVEVEASVRVYVRNRSS